MRGIEFRHWVEAVSQDAGWREVVPVANAEFVDAQRTIRIGGSAATFPKLFASKSFNDALNDSFVKHRLQPKVTPGEYLRDKHVELEKSLQTRTLIYLDTNHWVNLRHVRLGSRLASPVYDAILHLLEKLIEQRRILCPLSFPLFLELMKQMDPATRLATARLMDSFSDGVCFQYPLEIERLELRQRIMRVVLGEKAPSLKEWVFTKVGYITDMRLPVYDAFAEEDNRLLQKVSIDYDWLMQLEHLVTEIAPSTIPTSPEKDTAAATNIDAQQYRTEKLTFEKALEREKAMRLHILMDNIHHIIQDMWEKYPDHRDVSNRPVSTIEGFDIWTLPSLQVSAGISAALLISTKNFSSNDILDFHHAALSLPYCDALFCDGGMATTLCNKPLGFDKTYNTMISSRPEEIVEYLKGLLD
jgi:hypothetical protein